jgi:hypothetical protein
MLRVAELIVGLLFPAGIVLEGMRGGHAISNIRNYQTI